MDQTDSSKPTDSKARAAAYEKHLPHVRFSDLIRVPLGYGRHLASDFARIVKGQSRQLGEILADILRRNPDADLRKHFALIDAFHFPSQLPEPWRERGLPAIERARRAIHEICALLELKPGDYLDPEDLTELPLRYNDATLPDTLWTVVNGGGRNLMTFLPDDIHVYAGDWGTPKPKPTPRLTEKQTKCLSIVETHLGISDKTASADYIAAVERGIAQHIVKVLTKEFHEPTPAGGFKGLLIATLQNHPREDIAAHFSCLKKFHFVDGAEWIAKGKIKWDEVEDATLEALQYLALTHLKHPKPTNTAPKTLISEPDFIAAIPGLMDSWRTCKFEEILAGASLRYNAKLGYGALHAMKVEKHALAEPVARVLRKFAPFAGLQAYHLQTQIQWSRHPELVCALALELAKGLLVGHLESSAQRLCTIAKALTEHRGGYVATVAGHMALTTPLLFGLHLEAFAYFRNRYLWLIAKGVEQFLATEQGKLLGIKPPDVPAAEQTEALQNWFASVGVPNRI